MNMQEKTTLGAVRESFGFPGQAEAAALAFARARHAGERIGWSTVEADEPDRLVVAVHFGGGLNLELAVDRRTNAVTVVSETASAVGTAS